MDNTYPLPWGLHDTRDSFAMKLMKLRLQGPSFAQAPSKALALCSQGHFCFINFIKSDSFVSFLNFKSS